MKNVVLSMFEGLILFFLIAGLSYFLIKLFHISEYVTFVNPSATMLGLFLVCWAIAYRTYKVKQ